MWGLTVGDSFLAASPPTTIYNQQNRYCIKVTESYQINDEQKFYCDRRGPGHRARSVRVSEANTLDIPDSQDIVQESSEERRARVLH